MFVHTIHDCVIKFCVAWHIDNVHFWWYNEIDEVHAIESVWFLLENVENKIGNIYAIRRISSEFQKSV